MTLPVLRHESIAPRSDYPVHIHLSDPVPRRTLCGRFRPGLRIIVIQPDGGEERSIARWVDDKDERESSVLLLPSPKGAGWEL